jgi:hypothetical protein
MKLPQLSTGVRYDKQRTVAAEGSVQAARDWWACARCAAKVPGCYAVCQVDPSGVGCVACISSGGEDCENCFR